MKRTFDPTKNEPEKVKERAENGRKTGEKTRQFNELKNQPTPVLAWGVKP